VNWLTDVPAGRSYWTVVLVVILAHAGALWRLNERSPRLLRERPQSAVIHVWQLAPAIPPQPAGLDTPPGIRSEESAGLLPVEPQGPKAQAPAPAALAETPPQTTPAPKDAIEEAFANYLPRGRLTVPPQPRSAVEVPFPKGVEGIVRLKVQVDLFIDEFGTVRRVRIVNPGNLHPAFPQAVLDTFMPVQFSPGKVDAVAVPSQLRIEVEFLASNADR
jgi:hypothetical protein